MDIVSEIKLAIARIGGQKIVAMKMGLCESDLSRKINGERGWKVGELQKLFAICGLHLSVGFREEDDFETTYLLTRKLTEAMAMLKELKKKETETHGQQRISDAA